MRSAQRRSHFRPRYRPRAVCIEERKDTTGLGRRHWSRAVRVALGGSGGGEVLVVDGVREEGARVSSVGERSPLASSVLRIE